MRLWGKFCAALLMVGLSALVSTSLAAAAAARLREWSRDRRRERRLFPVAR